DGKLLLFQGGQPRRLGILDVDSRTRKEVIRHPQFSVFSGSISPDGRWVAFFVRVQPNRSRIYVAPFPGWSASLPIPEASWVPITSGEGEVDKPRWSPDGNTLYFASLQDGFFCLWAQRLDPRTRGAVGAPSAVHHFHQARLSMMNVRQDFREISVARDKIVFALTERTGNIWLARSENASR
ncbi:MAG: PD40 domain-containing protein, partial [Acidobacteria bacterium]|nr:PD40 domain-containing protein [Acidobacteriota bacterium]